MIKLMFASLFYGISFHYAYATYVNPVFEYAHYTYINRDLISTILSYMLVVTPVFAYRSVKAPAGFGAVLIYVLCYIPAQLILLFTLTRSMGEVILVQVSLAISMIVLFWASRQGIRTHTPFRSEQSIEGILRILMLGSLVLFVYYYWQHMRLVSFEDVYDLRFQTNELVQSTFVNYLFSWLFYCFLPYYFTKGILQKSYVDFAYGFIGAILIYMATGSKAAILLPIFIYCIHLLYSSGKKYLFRFLMATAVVIFITVKFTPDEGLFMWFKSILLVRVLSTGGWTISTYYDYFSSNGYTFYTHIGPINALTGAYPYGEYSLGQTIGLYYSGSAEANFNANFWASDGFAAMGVLGIPIVTTALAIIFFLINRISSGYSSHFVVLWLSCFWLALLNMPLTTAMLTGGGGVTLFLLWLPRKKKLVTC